MAEEEVEEDPLLPLTRGRPTLPEPGAEINLAENILRQNVDKARQGPSEPAVPPAVTSLGAQWCSRMAC